MVILKLSFLIINFIFISTSNAIWVWVDESPQEQVTEKTVAIQKRYYHIKRLYNALHCIMQHQQVLTQEQLVHLQEDIKTLNNETVKKYLDLFFLDQDKKYLALLWKKVEGFYGIGSDNFILNVSQAFFYILKTVQLSLIKKNSINSNDLEGLFDCIDEICLFFAKRDKVEKNSLNDSVTAGTIACRFYIIQRLEKSYGLLKTHYKNNAIKKPQKYYSETPFIAFQSNVIQTLYFDIKKEHSTQKLLSFYGNFQNFKYIYDMNLTKDFLKLYFLTFYDISFASKVRDVATGSIDFSYIINRIEDLSILELLESIDIIVSYYESHIPVSYSLFNTLHYWLGLNQ